MARITVVALLLIGLAHGAVPEAPHNADNSTWFPCAMTRYSTPLKLGWVLGISLNHLEGRQSFHGPFFQLEPGFGGGKINAGYRIGRYSFLPLYNIGVSGSILRTWSNPLGDLKADQTYAGLELSGALYMIGMNAGLFRHIDGDDHQHMWIISLGAGIGF